MIDAIYYDEVSTRRHPVKFVIHKRVLMMRGDGLQKTARVSRMEISERLEHAPRLLRFPEGGVIEVIDPALNRLLEKNRFFDPPVVRWQQNWLMSLLALIALVAMMISAYQWGLPRVVDTMARHVPTSLEHKIGDEELKIIDEHMMKPTRLGPQERARLESMFASLVQSYGEKTPYRLEFRSSLVGPNAFALPNNVIIMTDELVQVARDDIAVMGVLAHELGHLKRRHSLRRMLQALGVGVMLNMWVGDVSSALAAVPTFLLDQKYSRDFEREADRYAIAMMQANGLRLTPMAEFFEKMAALHEERPQSAAQSRQQRYPHEEEGDEYDTYEDDMAGSGQQRQDKEEPANYLSSHPSDAERIAYLRAADEGR
jgi:Zn-dependent protease with chaperone function